MMIGRCSAESAALILFSLVKKLNWSFCPNFKVLTRFIRDFVQILEKDIALLALICYNIIG